MSEETKIHKLKLDDSAIAHIVKLIQLGFITGTDIVDHFRMIQFATDESGVLHLDSEYENSQNANIEKMLAEASEQVPSAEEA